MNVLITGGAGFIGSHLAERCLKEGWTVSVIDDLSTGALQNLSTFVDHDKFTHTVDSIFNSESIGRLVDQADFIFHLAATVGVRLVVNNPVRTIETNGHGTEVVLHAASKQGKRVLIASSSEVYGKGTTLPFCEDANLLLGPTTSARWGYACSKMLDEFLAFGYAAEHGLPVTVVRFFNTAGPRQSSRYGMVLPNFVREALLNEPLTVFGTGEQKRCFGHVGDVIEALIRIAQTPATVGEVINIGNDEEISIGELAELVKRATKSKSHVVHIPYEQAYGPGFEDVFRRVPSLEKLERLIGFRPSTSIEDITHSVIADMAGRLGGPVAA